jgi:hypothetical protein
MMEIAQKNRNFWKMGRNRRKVAIAKDVLLQLATGKMIATPGIYCRIELSKPVTTTDLQTELQNLESCQVCGIGAVFVSKVNLANKFKIDRGFGNDRFAPGHDRMIENMSRIFTDDELTQIETLFEGWYRHINGKLVDASNFRVTVRNPTDRLILIMENIIKNKGELKPEQLV